MSFNFNWDVFQLTLTETFQSIINHSHLNNLLERPKPIVSDIKISDLKIANPNLDLSLTKLINLDDDSFVGEFHLKYDYSKSSCSSDCLTLQFDIELNKFCLSQQLNYRLKPNIIFAHESSSENLSKVFNIRKDVGYDFAEPNFLLAGKSSIVPIQLTLINFVIEGDIIVKCDLNKKDNKTSIQLSSTPVVQFDFSKDEHYKLLKGNFDEVLSFFETKLIPVFINSLQDFISSEEIDKIMKESLHRTEEKERGSTDFSITKKSESIGMIEVAKPLPSSGVRPGIVIGEGNNSKADQDLQTEDTITYKNNAVFYSEDEGHNTADSSMISYASSSDSSHSVIEEVTGKWCEIGNATGSTQLADKSRKGSIESNNISPQRRVPKRRTISFKELKSKFTPITSDKVNPRAEFNIDSIKNAGISDILPLDITDHKSYLDLDQSDEEIDMNDHTQIEPIENHVYTFEDNRIVARPLRKKHSSSSFSTTSNSTNTNSINYKRQGSVGSVFSADPERELEYAFMQNSSIPEYIKENKKFKYIKIGKVQKFVHMFEHQQPNISSSNPTPTASLVGSPLKSKSRLSSSEIND